MNDSVYKKLILLNLILSIGTPLIILILLIVNSPKILLFSIIIFCLLVVIPSWILVINYSKLINNRVTSDIETSNQQRLKDLVFASGDHIWETDTEGKYTFSSGKIKYHLGYDHNDLLGKHIWDLIPSEENDRLYTLFKQTFSNKKPLTDLECWFLSKSGKKVRLLINAIPIINKEGDLLGYRGIDKDITLQQMNQEESKEMQRQMLQSSKLASIGTLASSVAHELNNPLTGVIGFSQIIKENSLDHEKINHLSTKIIDTAKRMKKIIDQLRQFSRDSVSRDWSQININDPINNSLVLLQKQLEYKNVKLQCDLSLDLPPIWGDPVQFESIIQNFITNSRDAFETIEDGRDMFISITTTTKENGVELIYEDNAGGIEESAQKQIFEPFFTTKDVGKGTGLGMTIIQNIVKEHKGQMFFESIYGLGTTFRLLFPLDRRRNKARFETVSYSESLNKQQEKQVSNRPLLLLVDDEEILCEMLAEYLAKYFEVVSFQDGKMAIMEIQKTKFDLILTDLKMPNISGMEIFSVSKRYQPNTPVILMSGHAREDVEIKNALNAGVKDVLSKPFMNLKEIQEKLQKYVT